MKRLTALLLLSACGPNIPTRFVVERDTGDYSYRRYQKVLDVEFPVEGNPAEGHTALYVLRTADGQTLPLATAFVTVYERATALTAEVRERLSTLGTYDLEVTKMHGDYVWALEDGSRPNVIWVSGHHVVKLGGNEGIALPDDLIETYLDIYPSDLDENGRAREGTASFGNIAIDEETDDPDMPSSLREGAPR